MGYAVRGKDVIVFGTISIEAVNMLKKLGFNIRYVFASK